MFGGCCGEGICVDMSLCFGIGFFRGRLRDVEVWVVLVWGVGRRKAGATGDLLLFPSLLNVRVVAWWIRSGVELVR